MKFVPFSDDLLPAAAELLAKRQRRQREQTPRLPAGFEDPEQALRAVEAAWQRAQARGAAAVIEDELRGYLFADLTVEPHFDRAMWARPAGHALAAEAPAELYRDLYAAAGPDWLALGAFAHFVLAPAGDKAALDAFFQLGFGHMQAYALLDLDSWAPPTGEAPTPTDGGRTPAGGGLTPAGLEIRPAGQEDRALLVGFADLIYRFQAGPPVWAPALPEDRAELREGFAELVDDPEVTVYLAFVDDRPVAYQAYFRAEAGPDDLLTPADCVELKVGGTVAELRGQGVGRALTAYALEQQRRAGVKCCLVDWRVTNLAAARFWPRQGFVPVYYRLYRHIDPRVAWAHGGV